jgi:hypothetical protein
MEVPEILIPRKLAMSKPSVVRETIKVAQRQAENDVELLGIGALSIIGNDSSSGGIKRERETLTFCLLVVVVVVV